MNQTTWAFEINPDQPMPIAAYRDDAGQSISRRHQLRCQSKRIYNHNESSPYPIGVEIDGWVLYPHQQEPTTLQVHRQNTVDTLYTNGYHGTLYLTEDRDSHTYNAKFCPGDFTAAAWNEFGITEIVTEDPKRFYPASFTDSQGSRHEQEWIHALATVWSTDVPGFFLPHVNSFDDCDGIVSCGSCLIDDDADQAENTSWAVVETTSELNSQHHAILYTLCKDWPALRASLYDYLNHCTTIMGHTFSLRKSIEMAFMDEDF